MRIIGISKIYFAAPEKSFVGTNKFLPRNRPSGSNDNLLPPSYVFDHITRVVLSRDYEHQDHS